jgi:hypothetical protein
LLMWFCSRHRQAKTLNLGDKREAGRANGRYSS